MGEILADISITAATQMCLCRMCSLTVMTLGSLRLHFLHLNLFLLAKSSAGITIMKWEPSKINKLSVIVGLLIVKAVFYNCVINFVELLLIISSFYISMKYIVLAIDK